MKKISIITVAAFLILISAGAHSQTSVNVKLKADVSKFKEGSPDKTTAPEVNSRIMKSFNKLFSDAENIRWWNEKNNQIVYFKRKGKATRAVFAKNGDLKFAITTYTEEYLPGEILLKVKENYYGKSIFGVTEVQAEDKTAYVITLEDKTSWSTIKVLDGEITLEHVWRKAPQEAIGNGQ